MSRTRTVDFLPSIFQTQTNKQFLSATLDQLVQEPKFKKSQGYVGRRVGPGVNSNDKYVVEIDKTRNDYQLEPGVVSLKPDTNDVSDVITYPGILDALATQGADVTRPDRLFTSQYYTWDPFINFDKFVNFGQYYWLPSGPSPVDVSATVIPLTDDYDVSRSDNSYTFSGVYGENPVITLVRGGNYTFNVNQVGSNFWIQSERGVNGTLSWAPNISSRNVLGVTNNGEEQGAISFNVPLKTAQQFYYNLEDAGTVDLLTDLKFSDINNVYLDTFNAQYGGIDGITNLNNKTVVFTNTDSGVESGGWYITTLYDSLAQLPANNGLPGSFDSQAFDLATPIPEGNRYNVWLIQYTYDTDGRVILQLTPRRTINNLSRFEVLFGAQWSSTQWYKTTEGVLEQVPLLTAVQDELWYQDSTNPEIFGLIRLVDQDQNETLEIDRDIVGKKTYTSPNGVVFTNNMIVQFRGTVNPSSYQNKTYYVAGVGTAIQLLPTENYVTPETYTKSNSLPYDSIPYDNGNFDSNLNQPVDPDYITIALDSPDLNAWSRSNRWFHVDVINASYIYNNQTPVLNQALRAKRPIIEFRGGTRLFNMGTEAKQPVNIIDFRETDAFSNINGTIGYAVDGYQFINGSRVIFAADTDPQVRNKVWLVEFISPASDDSTIEEPCINLVPASDSNVLVDQCVVCLSGNTLQGISFYFDGANWIRAQEKTSVNQPPLFDVFDRDGFSLGNRVAYPSTTFVGNKLFSYAVGTGTEDTVLGFPLRYLTLNNIGDIVFENNLYNDTFVYVENNVSIEKNVSVGFVRQYFDRTTYDLEIGWQPAVVPSKIYQQFKFVFAPNEALQLDVPVLMDQVIPSLKIYAGTRFIDPSQYTYSISLDGTATVIELQKDIAVPGEIIEVLALSDQASQVAFYQVPANLENNPFNVDSSVFTLGTARTHYQSIAENLNAFQGEINGANNIRDLGNVVPYGLNILQQSSPLTLAGYFLRRPEYQIFSAIEYNSREYEKFKAQFLNNVITNDYTNLTVAETVTAAIQDITTGRTSSNPFYWSDMLPASSVYTQTQYTITPIFINVFDTVQVYNYTSANYLGLLVYLNDVLLTRGYDYTVGVDSPQVTILVELNVGDVVTIQEYSDTAGSFVPNTPTKLGLYPAYRPEIYVDTTYVDPTPVIRGHDGSITVAFGDFRDQLLLEFETRIYNNLKLDGNPVPLLAVDVIPGQFRNTGYSLSEINQILAKDFLSWVGWNKLDYKTQDYQASNEFTYNYSTAGNVLDNNQALPVGAWRGLYNYFYDTIYPNTRPWEMLGFSEKPNWWEDQYGPAPYTNGNLVLWDDLAAGIVRDPLGAYVNTKYVRPQLTEIIPAGSEGQLLSPLGTVVGNFDTVDFRKSWVFGDDGPVENTWRTSSAYPFAIMRLLALTRPAEFFSLFADRDLYKYDVEINEYLYNRRYRLDANGIEVYGNGISKASYIDWIVDYNRQSGIDSTDALTQDLKNLDVRLCYRLGAFTGKNLIEIYTEKSAPGSQNSSLLLPDESYNLLFYKNVPFDTLTFSSVIIQSTVDGWAVYGYSTTSPYFNILESRVNGLTAQISAGGSTVTVPIQYTNNVTQVPYGYVFPTRSVLADFLLSYGALLQSQGMVFDSVENGYVLDWNQMVSEFLYWSNQGWEVGSVINLNPGANKVIIERPYAIVDSIALQTAENIVLDQNRTQLDTKNTVIERMDNTFIIRSLTSQTINYLNLKFVSYENLIVLDNTSIFGDLIYNPATNARQNRIKFVGTVTEDWNGQLDAQGFVLNQNNVPEWNPARKYAKGELVKYKNFYYSANDIVQPSVNFNFDQWTRSDYTQIQQGLLPNIPNKSNQLANSYNINQANLELDQDLFSYGLIGFRPRQYMSALNLDYVTQVNLYRQFLGTKGTVQAAELFKFADLGRGPAQYDIYENWAVQRSVYGANANRSYYELVLNESLLQSNPSLIQVILPEQSSEADQTVLLQNVWKESYKLTSPDILTTIYPNITDSALPDAGYVDADDVNITVFDINDPIELQENIDSIGDGTAIWVAKTNSYDWNIYRSVVVPGNLIGLLNNLDNTSIATFSANHGLKTGDLVIIKYFDITVNGVYRVLSVPSLNTIQISYVFANTDQLAIVGVGIGFRLQTQRVSQASDVVNLPYSRDLQPGARVWVDDDGSGKWVVLEKQNVFTEKLEILPNNTTPNINFGAAVAQSINNLFALVGAPGANTVYTYVKTSVDPFAENNDITLSATSVSNYGSSISVGNNTWTVIGAPNSGSNKGYATVIYRAPGSATFETYSLLTAPDLTDLAGSPEFGTSVVMSQDERWMYIGAPGVNAVYAYARVDVESQSKTYFTNGTQNTFDYSNYIVIDQPPTVALANNQQIIVLLNNQLLTLNVDYYLTSTQIVLTTTPPKDLVLVIARRESAAFSGNGIDDTFGIKNYFYGVPNIYSIRVDIDGVQQRPNIDYTYDTMNKDIVFTTIPSNGSTISVSAKTYFEYVDRLGAPVGVASDARFGASISCTTDGRQVLIGAPFDNTGAISDCGTVYVYDRAVQRFIVDNASTTAYTVNGGTLYGPTNVSLNNQYLINEAGRISGQFTVSGATVSITQNLSVGDIIDVDVNKFELIQSISSSNAVKNDNFGAALDSCSNDCSLYVGAPNATLNSVGKILVSAGYVERLVNQSRVYGVITSTETSPVLVAGDTLRINDIVIAVPANPNNTVQGLVNAINAANVPNVIAVYNTNNTMTLSVKNVLAAAPRSKITVLPGMVGTAFDDLGFETYQFTQRITSPLLAEYSYFGSTVNIDTNADNLTIGAIQGTTYKPNTFDSGTTYFDSNSTKFVGPVSQSGVVYTFDYLPSASDSISNPGKFVFGQQIYDAELQSLDQFGYSIDYTGGVLMIGSPKYGTNNTGRISLFENPRLTPAWTVLREQKPVVDIKLINSVFTYDAITEAKTEFFDFIDPLQGKILGAARQNIDYIGSVDPARYNVGATNNYGQRWGQMQLGQIWWDTTNVRFVDPNQNDIVYASRRWSQIFPGSRVEVYQWIASPTAPVNYTGPGIPKDVNSYNVSTDVNDQGILTVVYYFWVRELQEVVTTKGKTLSTTSIAQYIENPRSSGIPYVAFINASTTALYNAKPYLSASDTILHIEFDRQYTEDNVHVEYELVPQDRADGWISPTLYRKLQDSLCGVDTIGNPVPDIRLSPANRYGIQFRPRQSMFINRYSALQNYIQRVNAVFALYPMVEIRTLNLLNSNEPAPNSASGEWDYRVANIEELSYQNFKAVPVGTRYLVDSNSNFNGLWTIYATTASKSFETLALIRIQNYDTRRYWNYVNWYDPGYNSSSQIAAEVANYAALDTLLTRPYVNVSVGSSVKVTANAQGKWEIYQLTAINGTSGTWNRVALQDGTIKIKDEIWNYAIGRFGFDIEVFDAQFFDQEPVIETRKIIQAINEELLIDELLIERNRALILIFNYVLSEFESPEWLTKTSLIDVDHRIRELVPYQIYQQDNQDFVVDYIQEVKPYHVQIRELNLIYDGLDVYQGTMTDFDLPAYYQTNLAVPKYISPVLLPYTASDAAGTGTTNTDSDTPADDVIWTQEPWTFWYNNYLLELENVVVIDGGTGYNSPPTVTVVGESLTPAKIVARINSAGRVISLIVIDPGSGYSSTPVIEISGGNGIGARAAAVMGNGLVRNVKTSIKFDRYEYSSTIVEWQANTAYDQDTQVRYDNRVWAANSNLIGTDTFDPSNWTIVPAGSLSGVNRTMGYYTPTADQPGLELPLLIEGVDYPGVQVSAPTFDQDTGFDVGGFDTTPYDNISYGPEGRPTYDPAILDAIYESNFLDSYLGTRPYDVNVDGGAFVDTYSSHAPEELVPGAEFDTLNMVINTRRGSDWDENGHGFDLQTVNFVFDSLTQTSFGFDGLTPYPVEVKVVNETQRRSLNEGFDYTVDWINKIVNLLPSVSNPPAANGDIIMISAYGLGGGSQLYTQSYTGSDVNSGIVVPVEFGQIAEIAAFVNGQPTTEYTFNQYSLTETEIVFTNTYTSSDYVFVEVMGQANAVTVSTGWSTPVTQYFVGDGTLDYTLDNSLQGTNPANMIVEINGIRARPPEGVEYIADGSSDFPLPSRGGYSQSLIADNDVQVWLNNQPQILGVDFFVEPYSSTDVVRSVEFAVTPNDGDVVLIAVWTRADYVLQNDGSSLYNSVLTFRTTSGFFPQVGDVIAVTTWNDTTQQEIVTRVFQGPITTGITLIEPFDTVNFDVGTITNDPGSYDYTEGMVITVNDLQMGRPVPDPARLWVTVNGKRQFYNQDYTINGEELILIGSPINVLDVVVIQLFSDSIVPEEMSIRIFQDMQQLQFTYRITNATTTELTQPVASNADIIYVANINALAIPDIENNIWGVVIIDQERIMYRYIDLNAGTISGLLRGTAGTAIQSHDAGALVYNVNIDNLAPNRYQDFYPSQTFLGDGSTVAYTANTINLVDTGKIDMTLAVQVFVGGTKQLSGYTVTGIAPVSVTFDQAPPSGVAVQLLVRQSLSWYEPGVLTPSNGIALQVQETQAAQFFRGL